MSESKIVPLYSDGDVDTNPMPTRTLNDIANDRYSRRQTIRGGLIASTTAFMGTALLAACDDDQPTSEGGVAVDAGGSVDTSSGRAVTINGSIGGNGASGTWTQTGGPAVALAGADTASPSFIAPSVAASTALTFQLTGTGSTGNQAVDTTTVTVNPAALGFAAVAKNKDDIVTVPAGYTVTVLTRLGDPIAAGVPDYANDGSDTNFAQRIGDHGDALHYAGLSAAGTRDEASNTLGLFIQNHENISIQYLHPNGPTNAASGPRPPAEAIKEIEAHGVSVTQYAYVNGAWSYVQGSAFNRRLTPNTPVAFSGPVRGSDYLKTVAAPDGTTGTGTINNCANGHTPWGTYLTCEENWAFYFKRSGDDVARSPADLTALRRYGVTSSTGNYAWSTAGTEQVFARWDARAMGTTMLDDYRNEPNKMGWVLEFNPYDPASMPRKRTALGRLGHEGAWVSRAIAGQKLAVYMGDDSRREYIYKFVSNANWDAADAQAADPLAMGDKYLDAGTLYVARFNEDGSGDWLPLVFGQVPARPAVGSDPEYAFASQADILVNARLAADAVGATPMDRPEWTAINPVTGEMYCTLTNNNASNRPVDGTDVANPRHYTDPKLAPGFTDQDPNASFNQQYGNPNGHIIRLQESGSNPGSTSFEWDIFLFGADASQADPDNVNLSGLTADNDFSSPDGLWFSRATNAAGKVNPLLWIETDDGAFTDRTNNQMLAALPGMVGDGGEATITNTSQSGQTAMQTTIVGAPATAASLRRFLVGPDECEITGVDSTPDGRTIFVGIQHPGEDGTAAMPSSNWPQSQSGNSSGRPRSAVIAITKDDGGVIGL